MSLLQRLVVCGAALLLLCSCGDADRSRVVCRLEPAATLAEIPGGTIEHVHIAPSGDGFLALWSTREALTAQRLDSRGHPIGRPQRAFSGCSGGFAIDSAEEDRIRAACLRPEDATRGKTGQLHLLTLSGLGALESTEVLAENEGNGSGVSIVSRSEGDLAMWTRGVRGAYQTFRWRTEGSAELVSSPTVSAGSPYMLETGGRVFATWPELWTDDFGLPEGRIVVEEIGSGRLPRSAATISYGLPDPTLIDYGGKLVVGFRDQPDHRELARFYLVALDDDLRPISDSRADVTRADVGSGPVLRACGGHLFAVVPRTFGTDGEVIIGVRTLGENLEDVTSEAEIAKVPREISRADAACMEDTLLIVYVEEADLRDDATRVYTATMQCH